MGSIFWFLWGPPLHGALVCAVRKGSRFRIIANGFRKQIRWRSPWEYDFDGFGRHFGEISRSFFKENANGFASEIDFRGKSATPGLQALLMRTAQHQDCRHFSCALRNTRAAGTSHAHCATPRLQALLMRTRNTHGHAAVHVFCV